MRRNASQLSQPAADAPSEMNDRDGHLVAVAVDKDRNSQHALKWAADHILSRGDILVLLHVRNNMPASGSSAAENVPIMESAAADHAQDIHTQELLLPFQCFCTRRELDVRHANTDDVLVSTFKDEKGFDILWRHIQRYSIGNVDSLAKAMGLFAEKPIVFEETNVILMLNCREVVLDGMNISCAIVDFVMQYGVDNLVLGASSKNKFLRSFIQTGIPLTVSKLAPDYCSVYVISKGRISSTKPASRKKMFTGIVDLPGISDNQFQSSSDIIAMSYTDNPGRFRMGEITKAGNRSQSQREWHQRSERAPNELFNSFFSCPSPNRSSFELKSRVSVDAGRSQSRLSISSASENNSENFESCRTSGGFSGSERMSSIEDEESQMMRLKLDSKKVYKDVSDMSYYKKNTGEILMGEKPNETRYREQDALANPDAGTIIKHDKRENILHNVSYTIYSIEEIKKATNNFSESLKVGGGGYGPVYKATLDHVQVAIKIPHPNVARGMEQFQQEVDVLRNISHPNIVRLLGTCPDHGCLVYEYMPNGNLGDRIFNSPPLPWELRFKIAHEISYGLLHLHETKPDPIIHRDLKPGNILLDRNFTSKITDVGLARLLSSATSTFSSQYLVTAAAGTFCYIDPEYQKTGTVGVKSDVYALGIILLQLITARAPMGLANSVLKAVETGDLGTVLDSRITDWPMEETGKIAELGLMCSQLRRKDRPDLGTVVVPELKRMRIFAETYRKS